MKILASDFDNTIYFSDDISKTKQNIEAIHQFVNAGNIFCIITGRNYTSLKKKIDDYHIPYSYLICEDGAKIFDHNNQCIDTTYLGRESCKKVVSLLKNTNYHYYLDDGFQQTESLDDCVKIVVDCTDPKEIEEIVRFIDEKMDIHIYASRYHVNIINEVVNKKYALHRLIDLERLDYHSLYVIGDNDNDYEMLKDFSGAVIHKHHSKLDELNKEEYGTLKEYIEELMKN